MAKDFTIQVTVEDMQVYFSAHADAATELRLIAVCRMHGQLLEQTEAQMEEEVGDAEQSS